MNVRKVKTKSIMQLSHDKFCHCFPHQLPENISRALATQYYAFFPTGRRVLQISSTNSLRFIQQRSEKISCGRTSHQPTDPKQTLAETATVGKSSRFQLTSLNQPSFPLSTNEFLLHVHHGLSRFPLLFIKCSTSGTIFREATPLSIRVWTSC